MRDITERELRCSHTTALGQHRLPPATAARTAFEASRHALALAGLKAASDASVSVNVAIELPERSSRY
jgi:hypothetical protein